MPWQLLVLTRALVLQFVANQQVGQAMGKALASKPKGGVAKVMKVMKKPSGVTSSQVEDHNSKNSPLSFKDKVDMLNHKMEQVKEGDPPDFTHAEMKRLWGRLATGLSGNEKAQELYKGVQSMGPGSHKKQKQQAILWSWWGSKLHLSQAVV